MCGNVFVLWGWLQSCSGFLAQSLFLDSVHCFIDIMNKDTFIEFRRSTVLIRVSYLKLHLICLFKYDESHCYCSEILMDVLFQSRAVSDWPITTGASGQSEQSRPITTLLSESQSIMNLRGFANPWLGKPCFGLGDSGIFRNNFW